MKISIVTAYYNRKEQFINTLKSIRLSNIINDIEVIVTDDCSSEPHRLEDLLDDFPFLKIIRVEPEDRWYTNPCVPFNKAINEATGDIIVMQNPECLHAGDILSDICKTINDSNYITYAVYSITQPMVNSITNLNFNESFYDEIKKVISPTNNVGFTGNGHACWYNHSLYRPSEYHFISAITKINMDKLNGFDEKYATGFGWDDDEFLFRVKLLGLKTEIHDNPLGLHQWHHSENRLMTNNFHAEYAKNKGLFDNITKKLITPYVENK